MKKIVIYLILVLLIGCCTIPDNKKNLSWFKNGETINIFNFKVSDKIIVKRFVYENYREYKYEIYFDNFPTGIICFSNSDTSLEEIVDCLEDRYYKFEKSIPKNKF